jgi:hypothetical protein
LAERPAAPECGVDGQWVETTGEEIADGQVDDENVGRRPQPFEPAIHNVIMSVHNLIEEKNDNYLEKT